MTLEDRLTQSLTKMSAWTRDLGLSLESHVLQELFDPPQSLIAFNGKVKRLAHQLVMPGIEERDHRSGFAEVAPRGLEDIALPFGLLSGQARCAAVLAKGAGSTGAIGGCAVLSGRCRFQVTDPGNEHCAPSAWRVKRICSAYSRAN